MKKETLKKVFLCEFWKIFKNTFFTEHIRATASALLLLLGGCSKQPKVCPEISKLLSSGGVLQSRSFFDIQKNLRTAM